MVDISNSVNSCCEQLAANKELITTRRVEQELLANSSVNKEDLMAQAYKIPKLISMWRIIKLQAAQKQVTTTEYSVAREHVANSHDIMEMQRKIFILESELNRYKHAAFRANNRVKCLEKKMYSFKGNVSRERQSMIAYLRSMLQ